MDHALTILPGDKFTENEVKEIVAFGFSREQVRFYVQLVICRALKPTKNISFLLFSDFNFNCILLRPFPNWDSSTAIRNQRRPPFSPNLSSSKPRNHCCQLRVANNWKWAWKPARSRFQTIRDNNWPTATSIVEVNFEDVPLFCFRLSNFIMRGFSFTSWVHGLDNIGLGSAMGILCILVCTFKMTFNWVSFSGWFSFHLREI